MTFDIFDVWNSDREQEVRKVREDVSLTETADLLTLDEDDVLWAVEECGQCDSGTMIAVPHGYEGIPTPWAV